MKNSSTEESNIGPEALPELLSPHLQHWTKPYNLNVFLEMKTSRGPVRKVFCFRSCFGRSHIPSHPIPSHLPRIPTTCSNPSASRSSQEEATYTRSPAIATQGAWPSHLKGPGHRTSLGDAHHEKFTYFNQRSKPNRNLFKAGYGTCSQRATALCRIPFKEAPMCT